MYFKLFNFLSAHDLKEEEEKNSFISPLFRYFMGLYVWSVLISQNLKQFLPINANGAEIGVKVKIHKSPSNSLRFVGNQPSAC